MTGATIPFVYRTTADALGTDHPCHVLNIPDDLVWGMIPLGWNYFGHTTDNQFDLWRPEHDPSTLDTSPRYRLWIPRQLGRGQLEARLEFASNDPHPDDEHRWIPRGYTPDVIWRCSFTTRTEISAALLDLQAITADPATLAVYAALHVTR